MYSVRESANTHEDTSKQSSLDFDVSVYDTAGTRHSGGSCEDCIEIEMGFIWPVEYELPSNATKWTPEEDYGF
jgi:hypothetical protein